VWGYGLRCKYSIFQQLIPPDGQQLEAPDPWLEHSNPWELPCIDVTYEVRFHWYAERLNDGSSCAILEGDQEVLAVAYDMPIPGLNTCNTNNFRLWESNPKRGVDLNVFCRDVVTLTHVHIRPERSSDIVWRGDNIHVGC
jgi:glycogen phosphorylase